MQRLITSSLIDSMNYYKSAPVYSKQKALADFSAMVKREPRPTAPSAQRGIDFENLVCKNCNTDSNDELIEKAKTEIINDDDTVFIDEEGNDIMYNMEAQNDKYRELEDRGINVKLEQRKMYQSAGINEDMFDDGENIMNWLLS